MRINLLGKAGSSGVELDSAEHYSVINAKIQNAKKIFLLYVPASIITLYLLFIFIMYSGIGRPIWTDEFLHFSLGGYDSISDVLNVIRKTTANINHGQTGAYMLLDYLLLKMFGASAFALRIPSLLSGALLLAAAFLFFRARRVGFFGRIGFLIAISGQADLLYYMGEARPYMPLAASAVGVLAYYSFPPEERRSWPVVALGWTSVILGASMHPYFPVYWFVIFLFCYWMAWFDGRKVGTVADALAFVNLPLSIVGTLLVFGIGAFTWLQGGPKFEFDPFQWLSLGLWTTFTELSHFQFVPQDALVVIVPAVAIPLVYLITPRRLKPVLHGMVAPAILILLALALSVLVGATSYFRNYWILPRQWVASMALVPLGAVWLGYELYRQVRRLHWVAGGAFALVALYSLYGAVLPTLQLKIPVMQKWMSLAIAPSEGPAPRPENETVPTDNEGWVALANRNIQAGGPVWPIASMYYRAMVP